jgi:hypothetical protein
LVARPSLCEIQPMRYFVLIALLCSCRREAPPLPAEAVAEPSGVKEQPVPPELWSWSWSSVSVAGGTVAEVRQSASARGHCRVSASLGSKPLWSVDACLATRDEFRFVSPDGQALVVLKPMPDADDAALGAVYRAGERALALTQTSLHLPASGARIEANKLHWLSAREQRETPEGVEVQLLDGSVRVIRFDGAAIAVPSSEVLSARQATAAAVAECSPCSYTDADGVYHLVENAEEIPAQYRRRAGRIRGSIQRADAVAVTYRPPSFAEPSERVYGGAPSASLPAEPAPSGPPVFRNELGENALEYATRIGTPSQFQATNPRAPPNRCIDNSGAHVPCEQIGMRMTR